MMSWVVAPQCTIAPRLARQLGHLADQRQDRVADGLGFVLQAREVERLAAAGQRIRRVRDRLGRLGRNDPEPPLGARECGLDLDAAREKRVVAEDLAHRSGAEHVGEDRRIESADRHRRLALRRVRRRACAPEKSIQVPSASRSSAGKRALYAIFGLSEIQ